MKLGITGLLPRDLDAIDAAAIRRVADLGFTGTAFQPGNPPAEVSTERASEIGQICSGEGVEVVEYGHYQTTLVDPSDTARLDTLATIREGCRVARAVGCPTVIAGIGSHNPAGQWFADRDNFTSATRTRLIGTLREAVKFADADGVTLALECHVTTTLRNASIARDVLDAVDSPSLKIHLDPVNWMTFETVYDNGPAIAGMYATLGAERISGAHSKGAKVENQLIVHLSETYTGADDDLIDHAAILQGLAALPGDPYLVIEHLAVERMPGARLHLFDVAKRLGLSFNAPPLGRS